MFLTIYICLLQFLSLTYIKTFVIISWHGIILKCSIVTVTGQKKETESYSIPASFYHNKELLFHFNGFRSLFYRFFSCFWYLNK